MCNCICNEDNEELTWRWADKIEEIRDKVEAQAPEYLDRYDDLVWLRARLMDYTEAIEATILGYDPDDPSPEAAYGDTTLEETIEIMATLPTVPADVNRLLESIRESSDNGGEPQSGQAATSYIFNSTEDPFEGLPDLLVEYLETSDMLQIHTDDITGVGETIAQLAHIYRNKDDEISGICIIGASYLFTDEDLDALRRRRGNPPTYADTD